MKALWFVSFFLFVNTIGLQAFARPKIIFLAGTPGSGKSSILNQFLKTNLPLDDFAVIDSDAFMESIQEYQNTHKQWFDQEVIRQLKSEPSLEAKIEGLIRLFYPANGGKRESAATVHFSKSMEMREEAFSYCISQRKNIVLDCTLNNYQGFKKYFEMAMKASYSITIVHVSVDPYTSVNRLLKRMEEGGRILDPYAFISTNESVNINLAKKWHEDVEATIDQYAINDKITTIRIDNSYSTPKEAFIEEILIDGRILDTPLTWADLRYYL